MRSNRISLSVDHRELNNAQSRLHAVNSEISIRVLGSKFGYLEVRFYTAACVCIGEHDVLEAYQNEQLIASSFRL